MKHPRARSARVCKVAAPEMFKTDPCLGHAPTNNATKQSCCPFLHCGSRKNKELATLKTESVEAKSPRAPGLVTWIRKCLKEVSKPFRALCRPNKTSPKRSEPLCCEKNAHLNPYASKGSLSKTGTSSSRDLDVRHNEPFEQKTASVYASIDKFYEDLIAKEGLNLADLCCSNAPPDSTSAQDGNYVIVRANGHACCCLPDKPVAHTVRNSISSGSPSRSSTADNPEPTDLPSSSSSSDAPLDLVAHCYDLSPALLKRTSTHLSDDRATHLLNRSLDVFEGREEIGKGSFGAVGELDRNEFGGKVAVKTIKVKSPQALQRLLNEASFQDEAGLLGGRGAMAFHCIEFTPASEEDTVMAHLVMEKADAGTLTDELNRVMEKYHEDAASFQDMGLSPYDTSVWCLSLKLSSCIAFIEYALDLSQQLEGCVKRRIVHCDIKAANVLIGGDVTGGTGYAVFCDWGGAHRLPDGYLSVRIDIGTTCYQAPESLACPDAISGEDWGSEASSASDMHSFALMQGEILEPFYDVLSVLCPQIADTLASCLSIHPCMRPSAAEVSEVFEACLVELREAEKQWKRDVPRVLDSMQLAAPQRSMHLMRHLPEYVEQRHALVSAVKNPDFVRDVDTAALWLAYDAVGCGNQLGDYVWSVACQRLGLVEATARLAGWDELLAHEDRVMTALRERMLWEGVPPACTMQQAKNSWPEDFMAAYRQTQVEFGAVMV